MKDEEGRYVFVNDIILAHFDAPFEEWIGRTDAEIWPGPNEMQIPSNDLAIMKSGVARNRSNAAVTKQGAPMVDQ